MNVGHNFIYVLFMLCFGDSNSNNFHHIWLYQEGKDKDLADLLFFGLVVRSFFSLVLFSAFRCNFALFSSNNSDSVTVALMCMYTDWRTLRGPAGGGGVE